MTLGALSGCDSECYTAASPPFIDPCIAVCYTPWTMRTGRAVFYLRATIPALLLLSLLASGCGQSGEGELLFTESSSPTPQAEAPAEDTAEGTLRSDVELNDQQQREKKLLILPFANATKSTELDTIINGLPLIIQRIFDNDRFISAESVGRDTFEATSTRAGLSPEDTPSMEIARLFRQSYKADVILGGRILMENRNLIIEPKIFTFNGEAETEEELPQMEVRLRNILNFINPLSEKIRDYLVELQ